MRRSSVVFLGAVVVVVCLGIDGGVNAVRLDDLALAQVRSGQPQAHWNVTHKWFVAWSSDIETGTMRFTGGSGPAWVVELSAPADRKWRHYTAVVVIDPFFGHVSAASVAASNGP